MFFPASSGISLILGIYPILYNLSEDRSKPDGDGEFGQGGFAEMRKYHGGESVARGVYLNLSTWEFVQLYGDTLILPGNGGVSYLKVPAALVVVAGPLAGLLFIIFLPLIGIIGIIAFLGYKVGRWAQILGRRTVQPVVLGWKPGIGYLTRQGGTHKKEKSVDLTELTLLELEKEMARRRQRGEK